MDVARCLYNINDNLVDVWRKFVEKGESLTEEDALKAWAEMAHVSMNGNKIGISSLHMWAMSDDPTEYECYQLEIVGQMMKNLLDNYEEPNMQHLCRIVHKIYQYQYKFTGQHWYRFTDHLWRLDPEGHQLSQLISEEMLREVAKYNLGKYNLGKYGDNKLYQDMKSTYFVKRLLKQASYYFLDKSFLAKLDANIYLLGFNNGIYDIQSGYFQEGRPEDCVSMSVGYNYVALQPSDPMMKKVNDFMSQIFLDDNEREHIYRVMASFLSGRNVDRKFFVWRGRGAAGISTLSQLLKLAMGQYVGYLPGSSLKTPPFELKNKRVVILVDSDGIDDHLITYIKNWVRGEQMIFKTHLGTNVFVQPQAKLLYGCSGDTPLLNGNNLHVTEFKSLFTENPVPSNKYQQPIDKYLFEQLPSWKEAFMCTLLQYYHAYKQHGIKVL